MSKQKLTFIFCDLFNISNFYSAFNFLSENFVSDATGKSLTCLFSTQLNFENAIRYKFAL